MKKRLFLLLPALLGQALEAGAQYRSQVWNPDNGDGTYTNPVINADYSDPDAICTGEDYYLTASSFNCIPGLPILHSRDLVNWQIIGHALQRQEPDSLFCRPQHGKGVWAPCMRRHNGEFYIYWGDPDQGVFMVKSTNPAGRWEEPVCVIKGKGMIDASPLWDDNGRCYLVNGWAGSRAGFNSVLTVRELSPDGTRAIGRPRMVFDGGQVNHTTEGPKFYKHDGWYWIMCLAGGVKEGWQLAMRSRSPYGPYEWRVVMAQGKIRVNGPHQGAWVHTSQGEDWFLHFNDRQAYGRVVYLQPVEWREGWPVMGQAKDGSLCGEPCLRHRKPKTSAAAATVIQNPQESDEFDQGLGLQWQWHANYNQLYGMPTADGKMRLYTRDLSDGFQNLWEAPNLLLQKTPAERFTATTRVRFSAKEDGQYGGLILMGRDYQALVVKRTEGTFRLQQLRCTGADEGQPEQTTDLCTLPASEIDTIPYSPAMHIDIYLRVRVTDGRCTFSYSSDGKTFRTAGDNFTLKEGKWIGAKVGYVAECQGRKANRGWIDADWFRVTP